MPIMWKVGLALFGLLSLVAGVGGAFVYAHDQGLQKERLSCKEATQSATIAALEKSQKQFLIEMENLRNEEDIINRAPPDNDVMGRVLVDTLNRL